MEVNAAMLSMMPCADTARAKSGTATQAAAGEGMAGRERL